MSSETKWTTASCFNTLLGLSWFICAWREVHHRYALALHREKFIDRMPASMSLGRHTTTSTSLLELHCRPDIYSVRDGRSSHPHGNVTARMVSPFSGRGDHGSASFIYCRRPHHHGSLALAATSMELTGTNSATSTVLHVKHS